jgi:hypothetical protein
LIALRVVAGLGLSDGAGTNDLPLRHGLVEAGEGRILGASEADSAVALSVGARALARAGVDRAASCGEAIDSGRRRRGSGYRGAAESVCCVVPDSRPMTHL